jgi:hypothetical protein
MNVKTARIIVSMFTTPVRLHSSDDRARCPLCDAFAEVTRTLSDASAILRYSRCPACGLTFKAISPPREPDLPPSKLLDSVTPAPKPDKIRGGKKKRGR